MNGVENEERTRVLHAEKRSFYMFKLQQFHKFKNISGKLLDLKSLIISS